MVGDVGFHRHIALLAISSSRLHLNAWSSQLYIYPIQRSKYVYRDKRGNNMCVYVKVIICTRTMPSLAERATMSAQEIVEGHSRSTASLMVLMYLKFLIPKLLDDVCSDTTPFALINSRDASHDCVIYQSMHIT